MKTVNFSKGNTRLFFNYVILAGVATAVDLGLLYAISEFAGVWYFYAAALSYVAGMLTNYTLNKHLNFRNTSRKIAHQFTVFAAISLTGLAFNQIILYCLVEFAGIWYMYSKIMAVFMVMLWNFYGHKKFTFSIFK
jgi:putative flippase GtrA